MARRRKIVGEDDGSDDGFFGENLVPAEVHRVDGDKSTTAHTVEKQGKGEPVINVQIEGVTASMLIDSASGVNLLGEQQFQSLQQRGLSINRVGDCSKRLYANGRHSLDVLRSFEAQVQAYFRKVAAEFVVAAGNGSGLLGRNTVCALDVLRTGPSSDAVVAVDAPAEEFAGTIRLPFAHVFDGVGKLKNYQPYLRVDTSVRPVAQPRRRVPFALRQKIAETVENLIADHIVERVYRPTSWFSPIMVSPRPSRDTPLCVDMRQANEVIIRERLTVPTVDEVLGKGNGSTVFFKLDFKQRFHQIELDRESRDVTAFRTHDGLFRYKRRSFEVTSAPE